MIQENEEKREPAPASINQSYNEFISSQISMGLTPGADFNDDIQSPLTSLDSNPGGKGMFADLNPEKKSVVVPGNYKDYSQLHIWSAITENIPFLKKFLGMMASRSSVRLGGMHHRGNRYYTLEITGCIYILMYLVLIMADVELL